MLLILLGLKTLESLEVFSTEHKVRHELGVASVATSTPGGWRLKDSSPLWAAFVSYPA